MPGEFSYYRNDPIQRERRPMTKRPAKPPELPWLMAYLPVESVATSVDFYQRAFGFEAVRVLDGPDGNPIHAAMQYRDARILIGAMDDSAEGHEQGLGRTPRNLGGASLVVYVYTEDVDALYKSAIEAGAQSGFAPDEMFWGDRVCLLFDPDGHAWNFATNKFDFV